MKKICSKCKDEKEIDEFSKNKSRKDGHNNYCKECMRSHSKKYYSENNEKMRKQISIGNKRRIDENRKKIFEYKSTHSCVDCGEDDPIVLQFDHLNNKKYQLSTMTNGGYSWETIMKEIKKCDVRCANCHMRRTATQYSWYVNELN